jgi:SOS-response transcriptional repressor LexA
MSLTPKQRRVLEAIEHFTEAHGHAPSYRELMEELGYRSTGSIYRFVKALQNHQLLQQKPRCWRNALPIKPAHSGTSVEVIGRICKHRPPELFEKTQKISVPSHLIHEVSAVYGLLVQDSSFLEEHILPDDLLLIEPTENIAQGELVLASHQKTIIGHYFEEGEIIRFQSSPYTAGGEMTSMMLPAEEIQMYGVIIGLIRSFGPIHS